LARAKSQQLSNAGNRYSRGEEARVPNVARAWFTDSDHGDASRESTSPETSMKSELSFAFATAALFASCHATPQRSAGAEPARYEAEFVCRLWIDTSGWFGTAAAAIGDLDGDAIREVAVGAPTGWLDTGKLFVLSVPSGHVQYSTNCLAPHRHFANCCFGAALCSLHDVDGDGLDDFAVGDPSSHPLDGGSPPYGAWIVSAATGTTIHEFVELHIEGYGAYLAAPGDLDGDGVDDLLVASVWAKPKVVDAQSGRTGERLYRIEFGADPHELVPIADRDGDGVRDFITWSDGPTLHSGATGERIASLPPPADDQFGVTFTLREFGDVDGDGVVDLFQRRYVGGSIVAELLDGASGRVLAELPHCSDLAPLGDLDGDGQLEFAPLQIDSDSLDVYTLRRVERLP